MGKGVGTFFLILILMWFIAPSQTEHMVTSVINAVSSRIDNAAKESATQH